MKRIFTILLAMMLMLSISAFAVEKTEKAPEKKKQEQVQQPVQQAQTPSPDSGKKPADPKMQQKPRTNQTAKRYDNFVDKNNNGIDDRKENQKPKENPPQQPKSPK
jgi:hypothetical protein